MKKPYLLAMLLLAALLLAACAGDSSPNGAPEENTAAAQVDIGGTQVAPDTPELDLEGCEFDVQTLASNATRLSQVTRISLGVTDLTGQELETLRAAFPNAQLDYRVSLLGDILTPDTQTLDLSSMEPSQASEVAAALELLPQVQQINLLLPDGSSALGVEDLDSLDLIRQAAPNAELQVSFELFGQRISSQDERIEYTLVPMGNEGAETVRRVLPYLSSCTYLLLDGCDIDNEVMAKLRDDFPETKVVWRVWVTTPNYNSPRQLRRGSFLTDTHRIRTVLVTDETCDVLKYCTETKYVDFGHNLEISDFSFLAYMPKLEAAIIGLTNCADLTPLLNCPELEYLEVYGSQVTDLRPLAACTKLKHLNISRMQVNDITCLYDLELERFRAVDTQVPKAQLQEYAQRHPDCQMLLQGWAPHENGWRYDERGNMVPRYKLLREQMEYEIDASYGIP